MCLNLCLVFSIVLKFVHNTMINSTQLEIQSDIKVQVFYNALIPSNKHITRLFFFQETIDMSFKSRLLLFEIFFSFYNIFCNIFIRFLLFCYMFYSKFLLFLVWIFWFFYDLRALDDVRGCHVNESFIFLGN